MPDVNLTGSTQKTALAVGLLGGAFVTETNADGDRQSIVMTYTNTADQDSDQLEMGYVTVESIFVEEAIDPSDSDHIVIRLFNKLDIRLRTTPVQWRFGMESFDPNPVRIERRSDFLFITAPDYKTSQTGGPSYSYRKWGFHLGRAVEE